ncbi:MAG: hypothetical protein LBE12_06135, partial [Planctomycetaceae bacterium]|nr:hypothetical protein [Planctomycetaceae bacterium]
EERRRLACPVFLQKTPKNAVETTAFLLTINFYIRFLEVPLCYKTEEQEYRLSSDSIVRTYSNWKRMKNIIKQIPEDDPGSQNVIYIWNVMYNYLKLVGKL